MISVKAFGELEFWAALIKVLALITFLVVGTVFLVGRFKIEGQTTGPSLWSQHGGFLPTGLVPVVLVTSGVVFAYAAVELVGTAAGETAEPEKIMPRAINSVDRPYCGLLCRVSCTAGLAAPVHHLQTRREPVRHLFLQDRLQRRRLADEPGGPHCRVLEPERRAVFHGPDSAVHVGQRQRSKVHRADVEKRCALWRDPVDRRHRPVRRRAQRGQTEPGLRNRAQHRRYRGSRGLGNDRALPTPVLSDGKAGNVARPHFRMPLAPYSGYVTLAFWRAWWC